MQDVEKDLLLQLRAVVEVHQLPDANAVLRAQLVLQEKAAGLNDPLDQELVSSCQNLCHIMLCHRNRVGVGIIDDQLHHLWRYPRDSVHLLVWGCPGPSKESAVGLGLIRVIRFLESYYMTLCQFIDKEKEKMTFTIYQLCR